MGGEEGDAVPEATPTAMIGKVHFVPPHRVKSVY